MKERPRATSIAKMVDAMIEEVVSPGYVVAESVSVDWCACCGVNIRLFKHGDLVAKVILTEPIAATIGRLIKRHANERVIFRARGELDEVHGEVEAAIALRKASKGAQ